MPLELLHAATRQGHKLPGSLNQQQKFLANMTHLHLNDLQLTELHSLRLCPKLQVRHQVGMPGTHCLLSWTC